MLGEQLAEFVPQLVVGRALGRDVLLVVDEINKLVGSLLQLAHGNEILDVVLRGFGLHLCTHEVVSCCGTE